MCHHCASKKIVISGRVDKETKEWIEKHPLSRSDLINYGLHVLRMMESNLKDAKVFITGFTMEPKEKETIPF